MKKFFLCYVLLTASLLIISCKDEEEPRTITRSGSYFTGNTGSTWIYSNYMLQSSGEEKLEENDTLIQEAKQNVLGKNAIMMKHHFVNPFMQTSATANYAIYEDVNDNKLYVNSDFLKIFLPELLQTTWNIVFDDSKWFLLADGNTAEEWILESFDVTGVPLPVPGNNNATLNGHLKLAIKRDKDTTIASANATANTYTMTTFFEGNIGGIILLGIDLSNFNIRANFISVSFYLAQHKGLLGIYSPFNDGIKITSDDPTLSGLLEIFPLQIDFESLLGFSLGGFDKRLINIDVK